MFTSEYENLPMGIADAIIVSLDNMQETQSSSKYRDSPGKFLLRKKQLNELKAKKCWEKYFPFEHFPYIGLWSTVFDTKPYAWIHWYNYEVNWDGAILPEQWY